jgi:hypothetical protein
MQKTTISSHAIQNNTVHSAYVTVSLKVIFTLYSNFLHGHYWINNFNVVHLRAIVLGGLEFWARPFAVNAWSKFLRVGYIVSYVNVIQAFTEHLTLPQYLTQKFN